MKEIAIWGIPPGEKNEIVLISDVGKWYVMNFGKEPDDLTAVTAKMIKVCENRGATALHTQEIDLTQDPAKLFAAAVAPRPKGRGRR
jgi:hypothetical protein